MMQLSNFYDESGKIRPASDLLKSVESGEFSILDSFGAHKLRKEMIPVGKLCGLFINWVTRYTDRHYLKVVNEPTHREHSYMEIARAKVLSVLRVFAPARVMFTDEFSSGFNNNFGDYGSSQGYVIGFNHPSLGEILRLIGICMELLPRQELFFPVSLPWYESLIPYHKKLSAIGIRLAPIVTPSARAKLYKVIGDNDEANRILKHLAFGFLQEYLQGCCMELRADNVVLLAPSATRQATVFTNTCKDDAERRQDGRAIQLLTLQVAKKQIPCVFVPVSVIPPRRWGRGLNPFKEYKLVIANCYASEEIQQNDREFGYKFLCDIAKYVPEDMVYPQ